MASLKDLNARYERQAKWFYGVRSNLLRRIGIRSKKSVLDLGCGTGVVTPELRRRSAGDVMRCDFDPEALRFTPDRAAVAAEARLLPYQDEAFDLVFTQMFFLWVRDVPAALEEIRRVLKPGGHLVAAAEPDYGGRIEHPTELEIGARLAERLRKLGADPEIGRKLRGMLLRAGFEVETGIHPSLFQHEELAEEWENEIAFLQECGECLAESSPPPPRKIPEGAFLFMPYFWFLAHRAR